MNRLYSDLAYVPSGVKAAPLSDAIDNGIVSVDYTSELTLGRCRSGVSSCLVDGNLLSLFVCTAGFSIRGEPKPS